MLQKRRRKIHRWGCATCQQHPYSAVSHQHQAINRVLATLDEKNRRRFVGLVALQWGVGCLSLLSRISGLNRHSIRRGKREIEHPAATADGRIRQPGGGRLAVEKNSLPS